MPRLSITLTEEQNERVEELVENGEYKSKNAVVQDWLSDAEKVNQVESENERLHRERRQLLEQRNENQELVEYVEDEKRYRHAGLFQRFRWWFRGME
jgi:Arc/MetJ-type ribon-helix-helix transcriptional regulator